MSPLHRNGPAPGSPKRNESYPYDDDDDDDDGQNEEESVIHRPSTDLRQQSTKRAAAVAAARRPRSPFRLLLCFAVAILAATTMASVVQARPAVPSRVVVAPRATKLSSSTGRLQQQRRTRQIQKQTQRQKQPHGLYRWGNFGHVPPKELLSERIERALKHRILPFLKTQFETLKRQDFAALAVRAFRTSVFWYFSKDCLDSIYEDRWHAERDPEHFFGSGGMWISNGAHKAVVRRRIQRSKRNRQWVGLGYTPRLVWLVGVLLRGTFQCTSIPKVFNPKLTGWGAGTILGAKCTHQEWVAAFMIGWFGSEYYWKNIFGCQGPPHPNPTGGFDGVPISITKIRVI